MTKVSIKKNVKPKTTKQKQRQTQKQNVTVNIGTSAVKRRSRQPKKAQPVKPAQSISQPIIQSYNQPIFKPPISQQSSLASSILASQPTAQPSSLASSILATQATPKVIAEEVKQQSSLSKALQEQITDEPVTKVNDLERVRGERLKKFDKPVEVKKEEPVRNALLNQLLSDQQDDTEEINLLSTRPTQSDIPFSSSELIATDLPSFRSTGTQTSRFTNALRGLGLESVVPTSNILTPSRSEQRRSEQKYRLLGTLPPLGPRFAAEQDDFYNLPAETAQTEEAYFDPSEEATQETPLSQPEPRGASEMITQTELSEPTPLTQPTVELGFGGLSEEPIQTSVGQILPPEPVSQNDLIIKGRNKKRSSLLKAVEPPPPITAEQETAPTILEGLKANEVRAADQYTTEQLVKDEPAGGAPLAESRVVESSLLIKTPAEQASDKWEELQLLGGPLEGIDRTKPNPKGGKALKKSTNEWLKDIHSTPGNENWEAVKPVDRPRPGPKKKSVVAEEIQVSEL